MTLDEVLERFRQPDLSPEQRTLVTVETTLQAYDSRMREALEAVAVPHSFNAPILARLLELDLAEAEVLTKDLSTFSFIEMFPLRHGWNVHRLIRVAVRQKLYREEPERFRLLSERAAACSYGDEFVNRVEAIYHGLSAEPEKTANELEQTYIAWDRSGRLEALHMLATALEELASFPLEDTARYRALVYLGWIRLCQYPLRKTEDLAREALQVTSSSARPDVFSDAHFLLARVLEQQGKRKEALTHLHTGRGLLIKALQTDSSNVEIKRDLAIAHILIGRIASSSGIVKDALEEYTEARRILQELIALQPDNPTWKREMSVTYNDAGRLYERQKDFPQALEAFQTDKAIAESLVVAEPENPNRKRDLAVCFNNTGRLFMHQGDFSQALEEYRTYHRTMQALIVVDPANLDWQRELSVALQCLGNAYKSLERNDEAIASYRECGRILRGLTELDPVNAGWQQDLSMLEDRTGRLYQDQKLFPEALASFGRSKEIIDRLLALEPNNIEWLRVLSFVYHHMGRLYEAMDDIAAALSSYQQDLAIAERVAALEPDNSRLADEVRVSRDAIEKIRGAKPKPQDKAGL